MKPDTTIISDIKNILANLILRLKYRKLNIKPLKEKTTYIDYSDEKSMHIIEETYKDWAKAYSTEAKNTEHPPIDLYCGDMYDIINQKLRTPNSILTSYLIDIANDLSIQILNAPRTPLNIIVYRALSRDIIEKMIENNIKEKPLIDHGFMSTSLVYNCLFSEEFLGYNGILKLYIPVHTPAIYIDQIRTDYMTGRDEHELLIHPNASLQIINYPYKKGDRLFLECSLKHNEGYETLTNL